MMSVLLYLFLIFFLNDTPEETFCYKWKIILLDIRLRVSGILYNSRNDRKSRVGRTIATKRNNHCLILSNVQCIFFTMNIYL